jgi:non-canonical purine NTP pyrophosphatase (RdgB/HAM1 family)
MILVLATKNQGKLREIEAALRMPGLNFKSLRDFPDLPEIVEDGATFLENAQKKARTIGQALRLPVLADDSGLEVDALERAPGIYSARFAGPGASDEANNRKLLEMMREVPEDQRTARFVCLLVLLRPSGESIETRGDCEGLITREPKGDQGFGYDPIFWVASFKKTMAEIPLEIKNRISHRAQALEKMKAHVLDLLKSERA